MKFSSKKIKALVLGSLLFASPVSAEEDRFAEKEAMARSLQQLTLNDLPPLQQDVVADDGTVIVPAGTMPIDFLNPYDMELENLSINEIERLSGQNITDLPVSAFPGLQEYLNRESKKKQFLNALKLWNILVPSAWAQVSPPPSSVVPINSLPGVGNVILKPIIGSPSNPPAQGPGVPVTTTPSGVPSISSIPGLGSIPMVNAILSVKDYFTPMDVVLAGGKHFDSPCKMGRECKEAPTIDNPASGTWKNQFIPCKPGEAKGDDCAHLEVRRRGGILAQRNNRWMSKLHKVKAGNWLCFKEPTGRYPFGRNPKLVAEELKENGGKKKKAQVTFALYFSVKGPFGLRSAACFGPVPLPIFGTRNEGDLIIFGLDRPSTTSPLSGLIAGIQNPGQAAACSSSSSGGTGTGQTPQYQNASQSDLVPVTTASYLGRTEYLHRDAAAAFEEMLKSAKSAGINLYALSGYRSISTQQQVLAANPGSTQIAQPGQSEHHTGYAVDIGNGDRSKDLNQSFEATDAYKWLNSNAAKYGFVQSYKTGSQYGNEPWHWRWQGNSTAQQLFNPTGTATSGGQSNPNCNNQGLPAPQDCPPGDNRLTWPTKGTLTDKFGWSPWRGRMHNGQDIANGIGTPIVAANCGKVALNSFDTGGFGWWVVLTHADGSETYYTHMNERSSLAPGSIVKRGQYVGPMGTSGKSTGPHIHFQYDRPAGNPVDPMRYLP